MVESVKTPSLFDMFEETVSIPSPTPILVSYESPPCAHFAPKVEPIAIVAEPSVPMPIVADAVPTDPFSRRYEAGASFVQMTAEQSGKSWKASLHVDVAGSFEIHDALSMSSNYKSFGDAMGEMRARAMELLRKDSEGTNGSFPHRDATDDANALYWQLGRVDWRTVEDPDEVDIVAAPTSAPVVAPIEDPAPAASTGDGWPQPNERGAYDQERAETVVWRVDGAIARVRILQIEDGWIWAIEWSTGGNGDVLALTRTNLEPTYEDALNIGKIYLLSILSGIVIRGELFVSDREEYKRTASLYRRMMGRDDDRTEAELMQVAA